VLRWLRVVRLDRGLVPWITNHDQQRSLLGTGALALIIGCLQHADDAQDLTLEEAPRKVYGAPRQSLTLPKTSRRTPRPNRLGTFPTGHVSEPLVQRPVRAPLRSPGADALITPANRKVDMSQPILSPSCYLSFRRAASAYLDRELFARLAGTPGGRAGRLSGCPRPLRAPW
jgi:hypothetical protein